MYDPVANIMTDVTRFLTESVKNRYVADEFGVCQVYTRKGLHYINGKMMYTLDVANISVEGGMRGNGIGTSVIDKMHEINPYQATFIESLLNYDFEQHLLDQGWLRVEDSCPPCLYKPTQRTCQTPSSL